MFLPVPSVFPDPSHPLMNGQLTSFFCLGMARRPYHRNSKQPRPQPAQRLNIHLQKNPRKMPYISEIYRNRLLLGRRRNTKSYQTIYFMAKKVIVTRDESVNCVFYIRTCRDCLRWRPHSLHPRGVRILKPLKLARPTKLLNKRR
ncbi:uncharacterized protein NPIL_588931 [Nephila pilipes]|uniref:Uncharacterized protein n=1 Tax=Nephila pilipes TaxID=299642 RepID=A0A8X6IJX1_NEPPI|nr:uncharacterized protein NPIL_588931 [Nephila pilipes]